NDLVRPSGSLGSERASSGSSATVAIVALHEAGIRPFCHSVSNLHKASRGGRGSPPNEPPRGHGPLGGEGGAEAFGDCPVGAGLAPDPEAFLPLGRASRED